MWPSGQKSSEPWSSRSITAIRTMGHWGYQHSCSHRSHSHRRHRVLEQEAIRKPCVPRAIRAIAATGSMAIRTTDSQGHQSQRFHDQHSYGGPGHNVIRAIAAKDPVAIRDMVSQGHHNHRFVGQETMMRTMGNQNHCTHGVPGPIGLWGPNAIAATGLWGHQSHRSHGYRVTEAMVS